MLTSRRKPARGWQVLGVTGALALMLGACGADDPPASSSPSSAPAGAGDAIKIGILTTCGGPFATFEAESFSGAKYALIDYAGAAADGQNPQDTVSGASIAGVPIEISYGCSDATPDKAVSEARRLVESGGVSILLGPLSGDEGVAVATYAKSMPGVTFVNGTSGAQSTTLAVDATNFFRFGGDGAQWMAGLASYAYDTLGWTKVAILGEDYSYPYTLAAGFVAEFCSLGGEVTSRTWVPLSQTDWSSPVAQLPRDVDGIVLLTGGSNTIAAEKAYIQIGGNPGETMLGGSSVMDPTSFTVGSDLVGLTGGSPVPLGGDSAEWSAYVAGMNGMFPDVPADSLFAVLYYDGMQAILQALDKTGGDLTNDQAAFRDALMSLDPTFPNGSVTLDGHRNSIQPAYVVRVVQDGDSLGFEVVQTVQNVDQTFGGLFSGNDPAPGRDNPACTTGTPPPWANG